MNTKPHEKETKKKKIIDIEQKKNDKYSKILYREFNKKKLKKNKIVLEFKFHLINIYKKNVSKISNKFFSQKKAEKFSKLKKKKYFSENLNFIGGHIDFLINLHEEEGQRIRTNIKIIEEKLDQISKEKKKKEFGPPNFRFFIFKFHSNPKLITEENYKTIIKNSWQDGHYINFIPLIEDKYIYPIFNWTKRLDYFRKIEICYDIMLLDLVKIIKKWYDITDTKNLYISNFGKVYYKILKKISKIENFLIKFLQEKMANDLFERVLLINIPLHKELKIINKYSNIILNFLETHIRRIWNNQIKKLQNYCIEFYSIKILKIIHKSSLEFNKGKEEAIRQTAKIFNKTVCDQGIRYLGKTIKSFALELIDKLYTYSEKVKSSPAAELLAINRINKEIRTKGLDVRTFKIGFGLTAAVRLRGQGNFQIVTSCSIGPNILNFSLINDRDTTEQDTKEKVNPLRIQPSLSFDINI